MHSTSGQTNDTDNLTSVKKLHSLHQSPKFQSNGEHYKAVTGFIVFLQTLGK